MYSLSGLEGRWIYSLNRVESSYVDPCIDRFCQWIGRGSGFIHSIEWKVLMHVDPSIDRFCHFLSVLNSLNISYRQIKFNLPLIVVGTIFDLFIM